MPKESLALERGGPKRLTLSWRFGWKDFTVSLDGQPVATVTREELKAGKDVPLPDGETLMVQARPGMTSASLVVTLDGRLLLGSWAELAPVVKQAAYVFYFLAAVNVVLGVVALVAQVKFLLALGIGPGSLVVGVLLGIAGFFVMQRSLVAAILGTAQYALDGLVPIVLVMSAGGAPPSGGVVMRVVFIMMMIRGILGIRAQKAEEAAALSD